MLRQTFLMRVAGPTVLVSLVLLLVCSIAAVILYRQHAATADMLSEDIDSRRIASEIEITLKNLVMLHHKGGDTEGIGVLQERVRHLMEEARGFANWPEESVMENQIETSFERYYQFTQSTNSTRNEVLKQAVSILERDTLLACQRLRTFNARRIEQSEKALRQTVRWMAWGFVVVGAFGSVAGIMLGYGVARGLHRSIYQLSVSIRDAAGKRRQELPTVTVNAEHDMDTLQQQVRGLLNEFSTVVERLQQSEREVLRAEQMAAVGQLAAGVAHELRNPLTAVKMLLQTSREDLEERGLPADDLGVIEQEIRRLERSLQTFLDFARPPRMERRSVDLGAIVNEAVALVQGRARLQKVEIVKLLPAQPVELSADGEQLRQLLVNLLLNALDTQPQGGRLELSVAVQPGGAIELAVADTGVGIAPEMLPRLFEPFVSGKPTGLGLGLVISRRIAEAHGGTLTAANRASGGACFTLRLPRSDTRDGGSGRTAGP